jgi:hypothetical protein
MSNHENLFKIGISDDDFGREIFEDPCYHSEYDLDSIFQSN